MTARGASRWNRRRWWTVVAVVVGLVATLVTIVAVDAFVIWRRVDRLDVDLPGSGAGTTYVLVGSDSREFVDDASLRRRFGDPSDVRGERADLILVVHAPEQGRTRVMSIPRDLVVVRPNGSPTRIALTLRAGPQMLVDTLCHALGVGADRLVLTRFDGIAEMVDEVGGVEVTVEVPMRDPVTGLDIPEPGRVTLDGDGALAYVRTRRVETRGPFGWGPDPVRSAERGERARQVLASLGARAPLSVTAPLATRRFARVAADAVAVDDGVRFSGLLDSLDAVRHLGAAREIELPVRTEGDAVPLAFLEPGAGEALTALRGPPPPSCRPPAMLLARP